MTVTVGIDPGKTGAIAAVDGEQLLWVIDMPTIGGDITVPLLHQLYNPDEYGPWEITPATEIGIEAVHSRPREGVVSAFTFGRGYGLLLGFFIGLGHRVHHIPPTTWKKTFKLNGKDKDDARRVAVDLWPDQAALFARKKDIGRAEAALIALHTARVEVTDPVGHYQAQVRRLRAELDELRGGDAA